MQHAGIKIKRKVNSRSQNLNDLPLRKLPKTLTRAAGLLKGKLKKTPLAYQKSFRRQW